VAPPYPAHPALADGRDQPEAPAYQNPQPACHIRDDMTP
jgi:hypothetical protein